MIPLFDLPHGRARALLAGGAPVYLGVNPVEYHGPHLSLHNDALVTRGMAEEIQTALEARGIAGPSLWGGDLGVGVDPCPGPGTRHTSFLQARRLVLEACGRLAELGAQRVVLVTFHGSPLHSIALDAGVDFLRRRGVRAMAPLNLILEAMLDLDRGMVLEAYDGVRDPDERRQMIEDMHLDFHAGFFETSLALHYAPSSVDPIHQRLPPCPAIVPDARTLAMSRAAARCRRHALAKELAYAAAGLGWYALRPFPGYTGRPHLATREAGAIFARRLVGEIANVAAEVLSGEAEPPRAIMRWLPVATLAGTVMGVNVPLDAVARWDHLRAVPDTPRSVQDGA